MVSKRGEENSWYSVVVADFTEVKILIVVRAIDDGTVTS
jgi:ethanolamine utilization protein EutP (predicted NTPase)